MTHTTTNRTNYSSWSPPTNLFWLQLLLSFGNGICYISPSPSLRTRHHHYDYYYLPSFWNPQSAVLAQQHLNTGHGHRYHHHRYHHHGHWGGLTVSMISTSASGSHQMQPSAYHEHFNIEDDEYEAIVLYPKQEVPFFLQETEDGEVAFAGYIRWDEPVSTIRDIGDVIVAIDGASTTGSSIKEVLQFINEKARKHSHSFFKFRAARSSRQDKNQKKKKEEDSAVGRLPGEKQRMRLEMDVAQIDRDVAAKRAHVAELNQKRQAVKEELAEIHRLDLEWIEQKRGALKQLEEEEKSSSWASNSGHSAARASSADSKYVWNDVDFRKCVAEVQQVMNFIGRQGGNTALKYDTLDHLKTVVTKLAAMTNNNIKKDANQKKNALHLLESSVGIKNDNYHVYVNDISNIVQLLQDDDKKKKRQNTLTFQLSVFGDNMKRAFEPASGS